MEDIDVHMMLNKKVAQLTKVIFHLNTKNDEAELYLSTVTKAYEQEVESILHNANLKVQEAIAAAEASRNEKLDKEIEIVKQHFEMQKSNALHDVETLRSSIGDRDHKNISLWMERSGRMKGEITSLTDLCREQASRFQEAVQKADVRRLAEVAELTSLHRVEFEKLANGHAEELQRQSQEQEAVQAALQMDFDAQLAARSSSLAQQERQCTRVEGELSAAKACNEETLKSLSNIDAQLQKVIAERDGKTREAQTLLDEIDCMQKNLSENADALMEKDNELGSLRSAAVEGQAVQRDLNSKIEVLTQEIAVVENKANSLQRKHDDGLEKSLQEARAAKQREKSLVEEVQKLEKKLSDLVEAEAWAMKAEVDAQKRITELQDIIQNHEATKKELREEIGNFNVELTGVKEALAERESKLSELKAQLKDVGISGALQEEALRMTIAELEDSHKRDMAKQEKAHTAFLESQRADLNRMEEMGVRLAADVKDRERSLEERTAEVNTMSTEISTVRTELDALQAHLIVVENEKTKLDEMLRKARDDANRGSSKNKEVEEILSSLQKQMEKEKAEAEKLQNANMDKTREQAIALEAMQQRLDGERSQIEKKHAQELNALRRKMEEEMQAERTQTNREHASELVELRQRMEKELQDLTTTKENLLETERNQHLEQIALLERLISDLEKRAEAAEAGRGSAGAQMDELRVLFERQLNEAREETRQQVQLVNKQSAEYQVRLTEIHETQLKDISQLREKLSKSHQERIDDMREKHQSVLDALAKKHESEMDAMKVEIDIREGEIAAAVKSASKKAEEQLSDDNQEIENLKKRLMASVERASEAETRSAKLAEDLKHSEELHEGAMVDAKKKHEGARCALEEHHKLACGQMLEAHMKETKALKEQFDGTKSLLEQQIDMLQKRVAEIQELYNQRPSLEEDLKRIAALEADLREKDAVARKCLEDMKFYKLELVNREQNYNKVFGAAPCIGVLNPLAKKNTVPGNAPPQMRIVHQPGSQMMQMGLPPLGAVVTPADVGAVKRLHKRPSSGGRRSRSD